MSALPSELSIALIGPSWARISSGMSSPMADTIRLATGSHSLRQTSCVFVSQSARRHDSVARMPDGSDDSGSEPEIGEAERLSDRLPLRGSDRGVVAQLEKGDLAGEVTVDRAAGAGCGEKLLQLSEDGLHLCGIARVGPTGAPGQPKSERRVGHVSHRTRRHTAVRPRWIGSPA
jgi:hypothetical protein